MVKLIIMNMYGNLVPVLDDLVLRQGVLPFLEKHNDKKIIISSRKSTQETQQDLETLGIANRVTVYGVERMIKFIGSDDLPSDLQGIDRARYAAEVISGKQKPQNYSTSPMYRMMIRKAGVTKADTVIVSSHVGDIEDGLCERISTIQVRPWFSSTEELYDPSHAFDKIPIGKLLYGVSSKFHQKLNLSHLVAVE